MTNKDANRADQTLRLFLNLERKPKGSSNEKIGLPRDGFYGSAF
jgi:hypothetical protein